MRRMIIIDEKDYEKVSSYLNSSNIKWDNDSRFYFHFKTFVVTLAIFSIATVLILMAG